MRIRFGFYVAVAGLVCVGSGQRAAVAQASGTTIRLNNDFINFYEDRVTIDVQYKIDKAHKSPNPAKKDGDMHVAGRAPEIGLPTVAELMNAKLRRDAVDLIKAKEGTGQAVPLSGVWRIWCEHAGTEAQIQGAPLVPFESTNPPHVFEVHPVTHIGTLDVVADTLVPIVGFETKDAQTAFQTYENLPCHMDLGPTTTTLTTGMAGYNYVEFELELLETPRAVPDGHMVLAKVRDLEGELLVHKRRMVLVKGSKADTEIGTQAPGATFHVLGIPRVNLYLVRWRRDHAQQRLEVLDWNLPYEIVVVGFYEKVVNDED